MRNVVWRSSRGGLASDMCWCLVFPVETLLVRLTSGDIPGDDRLALLASLEVLSVDCLSAIANSPGGAWADCRSVPVFTPVLCIFTAATCGWSAHKRSCTRFKTSSRKQSMCIHSPQSLFVQLTSVLSGWAGIQHLQIRAIA